MSKEATVTLEDVCGPRKQFLPVKKPGHISETTRRARELYLHGNGDGKPVRSPDKLATLSGAAAKTISNHLPAWRAESEDLALAKNGGKRELVAQVTEERIRWQSEAVKLLADEIERLKTLIPSLPVGSDMHSNALKLLSATLARWETSSGFAAYADCQATLAKEQIKLAARASRDTSQVEPRQTSGFSFNVTPALADSEKA